MLIFDKFTYCHSIKCVCAQCKCVYVYQRGSSVIYFNIIIVIIFHWLVVVTVVVAVIIFINFTRARSFTILTSCHDVPGRNRKPALFIQFKPISDGVFISLSLSPVFAIIPQYNLFIIYVCIL